jgi:hypothetical protein
MSRFTSKLVNFYMLSYVAADWQAYAAELQEYNVELENYTVILYLQICALHVAVLL